MQNAIRAAGALALAWSALFFSALARQEAPPAPPPPGAASGGPGLPGPAESGALAYATGPAGAYAPDAPEAPDARTFAAAPKARKVLILGMDGVRADAF